MTGINVAGTWKDIDACSVNVAGTWRTVSEIHANVGGVWKKVWPLLSFFLNGGNWGSFTPLDTSDEITAGARLSSNGQLYRITESNNNVTYQTQAGQWASPTATGLGSGYRAKFTESGSTGSGFTRSYVSGTYYNLGTTLDFYIYKTISSSAGNCSVTGTLVIETDPGGVQVASAGYTFSLYYLE